MTTIDHSLSLMLKTFDELLNAAADSFMNLAHHHVKCLSANNGYEDAIKERHPRVMASYWKNLESIGNGKLFPTLAHQPVIHTRLIAALPLREQERLLVKGVEVWTGGAEHKIMKFDSLETETIRQVIDPIGRIRTPGEQANYADQCGMKARRKAEQKRNAWVISGKSVLISRACEIPIGELRRLVSKIEGAQ